MGSPAAKSLCLHAVLVQTQRQFRGPTESHRSCAGCGYTRVTLPGNSSQRRRRYWSSWAGLDQATLAKSSINRSVIDHYHDNTFSSAACHALTASTIFRLRHLNTSPYGVHMSLVTTFDNFAFCPVSDHVDVSLSCRSTSLWHVIKELE